MKIECLKKNLIKAVSYTNRIAGKNLQLSVLNYVILSAEKNNLKIKATNLDLGIEVNIPIKIEEKGDVAVSGSILYNLISNLQGENIKIEEKGNNIKIDGEESKSMIKNHPFDDFPTIPKVEDGNEIEIKIEDFLSCIKSVWYSASNSTIKPELSSVYIYQEAGKIFFVATDSFRLAEKKMFLKNNNEFKPILIPIKNIPEIIRILESEESEEKNIILNIGENQISFSTNKVYITSRLTEDNFPDYNQIIPKEFETEVIILKQDLINAMKTTNIFLDNFNKINIKVNNSQKSVVISSKNTEVGENETTLDATINGSDIDISFNHKYINDCFQSINADSVSLSFSGEGKAMIISGVSDETFKYLVMPMSK